MIIGRDDPQFRVLVRLSFRYFGLACRLAVDARNEGEKADVSPPAGAVVLSVAALEAFVNEEADAAAYGTLVDKAAAIEIALKEREFPDRWNTLVRAMANVGFPRGSRPFQGFGRLHELRNAIVHYRPHFLVPGALPDTKRGRILSHLRPDYPLRDGPKMAPWTYRYLSPGCAAWACRTARDMVKAHFDLVGQPGVWAHQYAPMWPLPPELEARSAKSPK